MRRLLALTACVLLAGCGGSGKHFTLFKVPSPSMAPTFLIGDTIRVDQDAYRHEHPQRGDIVLAHPPVGAERNVCGVPAAPKNGEPCPLPAGGQSDIQLVKRVVAVGGDRVAIAHNRVVIDGTPQREPYARLTQCAQQGCNLPHAITVPAGGVFLLGDNRAASDDSRFFGPVPEKWIVGRVKDVVSRTQPPVPPGG